MLSPVDSCPAAPSHVTAPSPLVPAGITSALVRPATSNILSNSASSNRVGSPMLNLPLGGGSAHSSPLCSFHTPPTEDRGLNCRMARMFPSSSRSNSRTSSPAWSPNGSPSLEDGSSVRLIGLGESVASKIEQERRRYSLLTQLSMLEGLRNDCILLFRARGSIYAQRSRDNSKAQAIRLRLQNEVQRLQASNAQLDVSLAQYGAAFGGTGGQPVASPTSGLPSTELKPPNVANNADVAEVPSL